MVYYNKDLKKWESVGRGTPHALLPTTSSYTSSPYTWGRYSDLDFVASSSIGFSSVRSVMTGSSSVATDYRFYRDEFLDSYCRPVKTFGFPVAAKYHATGSQLIQMSDYINKPFLVEKIAWEIDANLESPGSSNDSSNAEGNLYQLTRTRPTTGGSADSFDDNIDLKIHTFFICRQFKSQNKSYPVSYYGHLGFDHNDTEEKALARKSYEFNAHGKVANDDILNYYDVKDNRELITYSQITEYARSSTSYNTLDGGKTYPELIKTPLTRDSILEVYGNYPSTGYSTSKRLKAESVVRVSGKITDVYSNHKMLNLDNSEWGFGSTTGTANPSSLHYGDDKGGRTFGDLDGMPRSIVNGFPSAEGLVTELQSSAKVSKPDFIATLPAGKIDKHSPYILYPGDEIFIGYHYPVPASLSDAAPGSNATRLNQINFNGRGKLILYGSQIKNNKEYHEGLNQHLTSDAIHETIGNDAVLDQFQIATRGELTGSVHAEARQGVGSSAVSGSLILPSFVENSGTTNRIGSLSTSTLDSSWSSDTAYNRGLFLKNVFNILSHDPKRVFADCFLIKASQVTSYEGNLLKGGGTDGVFVSQGYGFIPSIVSPPSANKTGLYEYYGASPQYSFNSSHFGLYSDMLQQGRDGKFIDDPTTTADDIVVSSPVSVIFVKGKYVDEDLSFRRFDFVDVSTIDGTSALEFQSANLSLSATSNSAFSDDGVIKNRTYGVETLTVS